MKLVKDKLQQKGEKVTPFLINTPLSKQSN